MTKILVRPGKIEDFDDITSFSREAIQPAFDHPDLTVEQRQENEKIISKAYDACIDAIQAETRAIFVALANQQMAGFIIADKAAPQYPEIDWLIVSPHFQGKGIAQQLMDSAIDWIGREKTMKLGVIHYNHRAIAFYKKYGFEDTGQISGKHEIPRILMVRKGERLEF